VVDCLVMLFLKTSCIKFLFVCSDTELDSVLLEIAVAESIDWETRALVCVGQDTRYISPILFFCLTEFTLDRYEDVFVLDIQIGSVHSVAGVHSVFCLQSCRF
jgi:hypothetical protein